jgi:hypothetical protein
MNTKTNHNKCIILDDGEYFIELEGPSSDRTAPGLLIKRCGHSISTPSGFECIGEFSKNGSFQWETKIFADKTNEIHVFSDILRGRHDAICTLWKLRHRDHTSQIV